jgi:hypothetical protein
MDAAVRMLFGTTKTAFAKEELKRAGERKKRAKKA